MTENPMEAVAWLIILMGVVPFLMYFAIRFIFPFGVAILVVFGMAIHLPWHIGERIKGTKCYYYSDRPVVYGTLGLVDPPM